MNKKHTISLLHAGTDVSGPLLTLGKYYLAIGKDQQAAAYLRNALRESQRIKYLRGEIASGLLLSQIARKQGKMDSSFYFTNTALVLAQQMNAPDLLLRTWSELVQIYNSLNRHDSTAKYQALIIAMKDSLFNSKQAQLFHNIDFDEQQRQQEIENVKEDIQGAGAEIRIAGRTDRVSFNCHYSMAKQPE